jgi:hypothetical protein
MWKLKEFEYDTNITEVGDLLSDFMQENGINDFEVVGYTSDWSEEYESFANHLLIKYWENPKNIAEETDITEDTVGDYVVAWKEDGDFQTKSFKNIKLEKVIKWTVRANLIYRLNEDDTIGALVWTYQTGVLNR